MRSVPNRTKKNEPLWFALSKELEKWSLHLLICNKERLRHVQEIIMHINTHCVAQQAFFATLPLPLSPCFAYKFPHEKPRRRRRGQRGF